MFKKSKRGFTLLEVLLTIAIIVLLAPLIITSTGGLLKSQRSSKHYNQAVLLAQDALEISYNLLQTDFLDFPPSGVWHPSDSVPWGLIGGPGTVGDFTWQIEIKELYQKEPPKELSDNPGDGSKEEAARRITATVSWTENGRDEEVELEADFVNWEEIKP